MHRLRILLLPLLSLAACGEARIADGGDAHATAPTTTPDQAEAHDAEAERRADGRAPYEALPNARVDPATAVRYSVVDGLLRGGDTLASARERLGAPNVAAGMLPGPEGTTLPGWTLYPGHPTRELAVHLDESGRHPASIVAGEDVSEWRRADGVHIGMSSDELAQLNGRPFDFLGFDWDMGGYVADWNGGALGRDGGSGPVRLCPAERGEDEAPVELPAGDQEFSSSDPRMKDAQASVCEFAVQLGGAG